MANIYTGASKLQSPWATNNVNWRNWQPGMSTDGMGAAAALRNPALADALSARFLAPGTTQGQQAQMYDQNPALWGLNSRLGINAGWINSNLGNGVIGDQTGGPGLDPSGTAETSYNPYTSSFNPTNAAPGTPGGSDLRTAAVGGAGGYAGARPAFDGTRGTDGPAPPATGNPITIGGLMAPKPATVPGGPMPQSTGAAPGAGTVGSLSASNPQVAGGPASGLTISSPTGYDLGVGAFLDPSMQFTMANGLRALGSSAAAGGQTFSGNTLKDILGYSQGLASTNFNNAVGQAAGQQQFNYGVDTGNRNFGYQAALNDQTIPFDQRMRLAQLGLGATGQQADMSKLLATLISQNTGTLGSILGSGTIGQNNALTNAISQMIANMQSNNTLNRILPPAQ